MKRLLKIFIGVLLLVNLNMFHVYAEDDPFSGIEIGSEIPGTRVSGQQSISCPDGSGSGIEVNATTHEVFTYCVKTWRPSSEINADQDFRDRVEAATATAEAESKAWNAANPGKQKCVQWGPIVHANGVSTSSGGVCANPVEPGPNTSVESQDTTGVIGPTSQDPSNSVDTSETNTAPSTTPEPTTFNPNSGNGYPFTVILEGQKSASECPSGYQAGNGIIVQIGTGVFTECWPASALTAWRLGGTYWQQFESSGGSFNVQTVVDRLATIADYKAQAKTLAQQAADQTPGVQRCSSWSVYGERGQECAYTFISPTTTDATPTTSDYGVSNSETSIATATPNTMIVDATTEGSLATPTSEEFLNGLAAPTLELVATKLVGSIDEIISLVKVIEKQNAVQGSVFNVVEKLQNIRSKTYSKSVKLPNLKKTIETARSLTPEICSVNNLNVSAISKGFCKIEYSITSVTGITYTTEKVIEFKKV